MPARQVAFAIRHRHENVRERCAPCQKREGGDRRGLPRVQVFEHQEQCARLRDRGKRSGERAERAIPFAIRRQGTKRFQAFDEMLEFRQQRRQRRQRHVVELRREDQRERSAQRFQERLVGDRFGEAGAAG